MRPTILKLSAVGAALLALSACSMAPVYQRPAAPVAQQWPVAAGSAASPATPASAVLWRDYFSDDRLRQVIALALNNNRDLRISVLNIDKARAQHGISEAALLPSVSAQVGQNATRSPSVGGTGSINRQYSGGLALPAYELDLFGKLRNLSDASLQQYLGTEEARRTQQISLVAEVANAWLVLQADQQRLQLARDTLASQQATYQLSQQRFAKGVSSGLDLAETQTSVEAARDEVASYTAQVAQDSNALVLLVGAQVPEALLPQGALDAPGAVTRLAELPAGLPSSVLLERPDVQEAERSLRAANANIGVARPAFFPSVSLTASGGSASGSLSGLFKAGSGTWSFLPQVTLPLFDGGVNRANLRIAQADRDIAVARYEKSIQSAFREVADALAVRSTVDQRLTAQQALVDAAGTSFRIHDARYRQGAESYLNALVSQRALYAAQQSLITARLAKSSNAVTLYKVLGGGWQPEIDKSGQLAHSSG